MARRGGGGASRYDTPLDPAAEAAFQQWKAQHAPLDSGQDYDLRGAYQAGFTPDPMTGHWPDEFKKPNHPTFSDQSRYAILQPWSAGSWQGETFTPNPVRELLTSLLGARLGGGGVQPDQGGQSMRKPGGDETPVRGPLSRLDVPTSRQDPLAPYDPTDPAMRWIDEPTSRTDPVTRTVQLIPLAAPRSVSASTSRVDPVNGLARPGDRPDRSVEDTRDRVPLMQGRRFRHHQPYTTGQRGPHR